MNCPACQRDNHAARRYCGGCGCNFAPACGDCGFANDHADRYCGGCGQGLRAGARAGDRPGDRVGDRPGDRPGDRSGDRPGERPAWATIAPGERRSPTLAPPPAAAAAQAGVGVWDLHELAELFTPAPIAEETPDLPEVGISQGDVDRLFGGAS